MNVNSKDMHDAMISSPAIAIAIAVGGNVYTYHITNTLIMIPLYKYTNDTPFCLHFVFGMRSMTSTLPASFPGVPSVFVFFPLCLPLTSTSTQYCSRRFPS